MSNSNKPNPIAIDQNLCAYRESMYSFFKRSRAQNIAGQAGGSLVILLLTWQIADPKAMLTYLITHQLLVLATAYTYYSKYTNQRITRDGLPKYVFEIGLLTRTICGSVFWFDLQATQNHLFVMSALVVFTASIVGTLVTMGPLNKFARHALACLLLPGAAACAFVGHYVLCAAILYFLYVVAYKGLADLRATYHELISLRESSALATRKLEQSNDELQETNRNLRREVLKRESSENERQALQDELMSASREAGKAEIATGVLHNVGNVMNSVSVTTGVLQEKMRELYQVHLKCAVELLESNSNNLLKFFANDERANHFVPFLGELYSDCDEIYGEFRNLRDSVNHVISVVAAQQSFATTVGGKTQIAPRDAIEAALRILVESFKKHSIEIEKQLDDSVGSVLVDRQKLIQIFVNLLNNAKNAINDADPEIKKITIRLYSEEGNVLVEVQDTGIGIRADNLQKIFQHGFSTRKESGGCGFGLHHSVCAVEEMEGKIYVESEGLFQGAKFTLSLPMETEPIPSVPDASLGPSGLGIPEIAPRMANES